MSKSKKKEIVLFGDEEDETADLSIGFNKNYAERYENWRGKEEMQKRNTKKHKLAGQINSNY